MGITTSTVTKIKNRTAEKDFRMQFVFFSILVFKLMIFKSIRDTGINDNPGSFATGFNYCGSRSTKLKQSGSRKSIKFGFPIHIRNQEEQMLWKLSEQVLAGKNPVTVISSSFSFIGPVPVQ